MQEIILTGHVNGTVTVETRGFQGQACQRATASIMRALAGQDVQTEETAEAALAEVADETVHADQH